MYLRIFEDQFDINKGIFDCGSCLTYFRTRFIKEDFNTLKLDFTKLEDFQYNFPHFSKTIQPHLKEGQKMTLIFWHRGLDEECDLLDETFSGPCKLFIVNSKKSSPFRPGTILELESEDELSLKYSDFAYGFVFTLEDL